MPANNQVPVRHNEVELLSPLLAESQDLTARKLNYYLSLGVFHGINNS